MKDKGIVYKDISMGNLMFDADSYDEELDRRRGMIIDFGTCMEMGKVLQNYDLIDRAVSIFFLSSSHKLILLFRGRLFSWR